MVGCLLTWSGRAVDAWNTAALGVPTEIGESRRARCTPTQSPMSHGGGCEDRNHDVSRIMRQADGKWAASAEGARVTLVTI